jgi:hypothetical protein
MVTWEPVILELEVSADAWDGAVREVEEWNRRSFGEGAAWVPLTSDEAVEALAHYGFLPLVRGLLREGSPHLSMALHLSPRRVGGKSGRGLEEVVSVKEERVALTISDRTTQGVLFAVSGQVPRALEKAARQPLALARAASARALTLAGVTP